jgi:hypothetical protein
MLVRNVPFALQNAAGHILVCKAFAPLLINAAKASCATE